MENYNEDAMLVHMLMTEHMPEVLLSIFKTQKIEVDLKDVNKKAEEIFDTSFVGEDPATALLIAVLLVRHLYTIFSAENTNMPSETPMQRMCLKKEFIQGYN